LTPLVDERYLDARRGDILAAAQRVFVQKGFAAATMHDIAADAGVSAGSIYRYFDSKEDLIRAVTAECEQGYKNLFALPGPMDDTSPLRLLQESGHQVWRALTDAGAHDLAVLNLESTLVAARNPEVAAALAEAMRATPRLLVQLVQLAQQRGELEAGVDAVALATLLVAATSGLQMLSLQLQGDVDVEAVWTVLGRLLDGIKLQEARA
jgi:AcrR family transcriptional regulator